jgi:hypothetical protein
MGLLLLDQQLGVINHVDEAIKLGWVLNLVLCFGENLAEHTLAAAQFARGGF